jgi:hypothetical protein
MAVKHGFAMRRVKHQPSRLKIGATTNSRLAAVGSNKGFYDHQLQGNTIGPLFLAAR